MKEGIRRKEAKQKKDEELARKKQNKELNEQIQKFKVNLMMILLMIKI